MYVLKASTVQELRKDIVSTMNFQADLLALAANRERPRKAKCMVEAANKIKQIAMQFANAKLEGASNANALDNTVQ